MIENVIRPLREAKALTQEDVARALGIDRQILAQVTSEIALDQEARKMRLGLADSEIAKRITSDPGFQTPAGPWASASVQKETR